MKYEDYEKRCENCFSLVEGEDGEWWCDECDDCCEDITNCPEGLTGKEKRFCVHVSVTMETDVYVYANDADEAFDKVDNDVSPTDYCNETCGFETYDDYEFGGVTCECNDMVIHSVVEEDEV